MPDYAERRRFSANLGLHNGDAVVRRGIYSWNRVFRVFFGKVKCLEKRSIKDIAKAAVEQGLASTEYELVDVQFKSERGQWFLNIFVDKPGGITLDDCELVNKLIDPILDAEQDIAGKHDYLIVSSPGLDRPIKTDSDFRRNMGRVLDIKLFSPMNKKKEFTGVLQGFDDENAFLEIAGLADQVVIKRANIAKAQQHIEF
jgi:ribosome maturation factor RimP